MVFLTLKCVLICSESLEIGFGEKIDLFDIFVKFYVLRGGGGINAIWKKIKSARYSHMANNCKHLANNIIAYLSKV